MAVRRIERVTVAPVPPAGRAALDRMPQLHLHDLSESLPLGTPRGELDAECPFAHLRGWAAADESPAPSHR